MTWKVPVKAVPTVFLSAISTRNLVWQPFPWQGKSLTSTNVPGRQENCEQSGRTFSFKTYSSSVSWCKRKTSRHTVCHEIDWPLFLAKKAHIYCLNSKSWLNDLIFVLNLFLIFLPALDTEFQKRGPVPYTSYISYSYTMYACPWLSSTISYLSKPQQKPYFAMTKGPII